jgi:hypothetical protein
VEIERESVNLKNERRIKINEKNSIKIYNQTIVKTHTRERDRIKSNIYKAY